MKRYKLIRMADCVDSKRRPERKLKSFMIVSVLSAIAFFIFWQNYPDISYHLRLLEVGLSFFEDNPWALIAVMATLPGLGFPSSPVLVLFGVVIATHYGMPAAAVLAIAAQILCSIWTYALSSGPLKVLLLRCLLRGRTLPDISEHNTVRLGLILRLTPGIPIRFTKHITRYFRHALSGLFARFYSHDESVDDMFRHNWGRNFQRAAWVGDHWDCNFNCGHPCHPNVEPKESC